MRWFTPTIYQRERRETDNKPVLLRSARARLTERQTKDRQAEIDGRRYMHTDTDANRQRDRQERQTDRQKERQADRQRRR